MSLPTVGLMIVIAAAVAVTVSAGSFYGFVFLISGFEEEGE